MNLLNKTEKNTFRIQSKAVTYHSLNEQVKKAYLTIKLLDDMVNKMTEEGVKPFLDIPDFDDWFNLAISVKPEYEFSEDLSQITGKFELIDFHEFDGLLIDSVSLFYIKKIERSEIDPVFEELENQLNSEDHGLDEFLEINSKIFFLDYILSFIDLFRAFLTNDFSTARDILNVLIESNLEDNYFVFLIIVKFILDFNDGNAAEAVDFFRYFLSKGFDEYDLNHALEVPYMVAGNFLINSNPAAMKLVLKDKDFANSDKCRFLLALFDYLEESDDDDELNDLLKKAERYIDHDLTLILKLADDYLKIGNVSKALSLISKLSKEDQNKEIVKYSMARAFNRNGKFNQSLELIDELLIAYDYSLDISDEKALALIGLNRLDEAERIWKDIVDKEPDNWKSLINLAVFYFTRKKNNRQTLHYLLEAEKYISLHPSYLMIISKIYEGMGLMKKKNEYLKKAGLEDMEMD